MPGENPQRQKEKLQAPQTKAPNWEQDPGPFSWKVTVLLDFKHVKCSMGDSSLQFEEMIRSNNFISTIDYTLFRCQTYLLQYMTFSKCHQSFVQFH